jgi:hypothetical protein
MVPTYESCMHNWSTLLLKRHSKRLHQLWNIQLFNFFVIKMLF